MNGDLSDRAFLAIVAALIIPWAAALYICYRLVFG